MFTVWRRAADLPPWIRALLVGQAVSAAGAFAWLYLTLYLVADRGLDPQRAGLVTAAFGAGTIAGNLGGGFVGDRIGLRRAVLASLLGWAACCAAVPLASTPALPVLTAVAGALSGASRPVLSALVAATLPTDRRREGIALSRTASNAGFVIGPPLGALLAAHAFGAIFVADAATSLVLAAIVWRAVPAGDPGPSAPPGPRPPLWRAIAADRRVVVLLATILVIDTVYRQLFTTVPLLLRDAGEPTVLYGLLITVSSAIIVVAEAPLAVALRHRPAALVVGGGFVLVGAGLLVLGIWPGAVGAVAGVAVLTGGEMLYKPTATAYVADAAPGGMAGRYQSLYAATSISGMLLAPVAGGAVYAHAPRLLWPAAALVAVLAAAALYVGTRRADRAPAPDQPALTGAGGG